MKKVVLACILLGTLTEAFSQEKGYDKVTPISKANLICGKVNGKFIVFSQPLNRAWYIISTDKNYKILKAVQNSQDIEGVKAFEYSLVVNTYKLPTIERQGGAALVMHRLDGGVDASLLSVRPSSTGSSIRLFQGEDGSNGVCTFLSK